MIFSKVHSVVLQRLQKLPQSAQTLYLGKSHYGFQEKQMSFHQQSRLMGKGLPYKNRSIDFLYAQVHENVESPFFLQQELLRTCKAGILTFRSPLSTAILDLPDDAEDLDAQPRFAIWTDIHTNQLCFLPITANSWYGLQYQRDKWVELSQFNPLFFFSIYEFEHAMELNIKLYSAQMNATEFRDLFQEACHASVRHTQWWLESNSDAQVRSP